MNFLRTTCQSSSSAICASLKLAKVLTHGQTLEDYLRKNKMADHSETVYDVFARATTSLAEAGEKFYGPDGTKRYSESFLNQVARFQVILGSPILTNAGRRLHKSISACSIPPVRFSKMTLDEISRMVSDYHVRGMGTGFCLDDLEDPVSMVLFLNDIAVKEVQQGKIERSCSNMGSLSVHHPKVLEFIRLKAANPHIREWKFNISVNMTQAFMQAWEERRPFFFSDGTEVDPYYLMHEIAKNAHATGDPGVLFMDRMNELNRVPQLGSYKAVVPCGEVSMFEGEVCQFAYVNLSRFVKDQKVDKEGICEAVREMVVMLDNAVEANIDKMPNEESKNAISAVRRIGIGVLGFSEMLQQLGIAYDSDEGRRLALDVMSLINFESKSLSVDLAKERGPFPRFLTEGTRRSLFISAFKNRPTSYVTEQDWQMLEERFERLSIRNISTTILPPAGRSASLAGVTGSIEPPFRLIGDAALRSALQAACSRFGYTKSLESILAHIEETGSLQDTDLPNGVKDIFKCALELSPQAHMRMTAVWQKHVDEAISKTINLPNTTTVDEVVAVFGTCYSYGLKGLTVYRDGSRTLQPKSLTTKKESFMNAPVTIDTLYGPIQVSQKIGKLLQEPLLTRLKNVRQNGVAYLIDPRQSASRYDHSVGAMSLAKLLGADEQGQIAALLHDVPHTVFSHLGDIVFGQVNQDFHEQIRHSFLRTKDAQRTIEALGLTDKELNAKQIPLVKGDGINVDRLDYFIRDLLAVGRIFQPEYAAIIHNLVVDAEGTIRCKDIDTARLLFRKFIEVNTEVYFDMRVEAASCAVAALLKHMLADGLLIVEDFLKTDDHLLEKVARSPYKAIYEQIGPDMAFSVSKTPTTIPHVVRKLRYIDPLIDGMEGTLTAHCQESKKHLDAYLKTKSTHYYSIPLVQDLC